MDRSKKIPFKMLSRTLESLGYKAQGIEGGRVVFTHPKRTLLIVLPALRPDDVVSPIDLISVRNTLLNDGVIRDVEESEGFFRIKKGDKLVWTEPRSKRQSGVVAASGETSDGLVIIKQKGAFSPCPVSQLTRPEDVEAAAKEVDSPNSIKKIRY